MLTAAAHVFAVTATCPVWLIVLLWLSWLLFITLVTALCAYAYVVSTSLVRASTTLFLIVWESEAKEKGGLQWHEVGK